MTRHEMRTNVFFLTFEKIFNDDKIEDLIECAKNNEIIALNNEVVYMASEIQRHLEEIDIIISENLEKWNISRISKVVLAILRVAVFEIKYADSIPDAIAINEAVELAKEYSSQEDASFINGVLGSFVRKLKTVEPLNE